MRYQLVRAFCVLIAVTSLTVGWAATIERGIIEEQLGILGVEVAIGAGTMPHVLYTEGPYFYSQKMAVQVGPTPEHWFVDTISELGATWLFNGETVLVDSDFGEHILLSVVPTDDLRYGYRAGGSGPWTWSTVARRNQRLFAELVLDSNGEPRVYYVVSGRLRVAVKVGNSWQAVDLLTTGYDPVVVEDVALDANGQSHVLYRGYLDNDPLPELKYGIHGAGGWTIDIVATVLDGSEANGRLALDSEGQAHIAYISREPNNWRLHYLRPTAPRVWEPDDPSFVRVSRVWIDVDRFDQPVLISRTYGDSQLFLHYRRAGAWAMAVVEEDETGAVGFDLDRLDRAQIAYHANRTELRFARVSVNEAPILSEGFTFDPIVGGHPQASYSGHTVAEMLEGRVTSPGGTWLWGDPGIAVYAPSAAGGWWSYSIDGGATWTNLDFLRDLADLGLPNMAVLLPPTARVRFAPAGGFAGVVSNGLPYCAWDRYVGAIGDVIELPDLKRGGVSGFSLEVQAASITVDPFSNEAPSLTAADTVWLDPVGMNASDSEIAGTPVAHLLAQVTVSDANQDPIGIAITGTHTDHGALEFRLDSQATWTALAPTPDNAILLTGDDWIRFRPATGFVGMTDAIDFRAWDQTSSDSDATVHGGSSAFSATEITARIEVIAPNYAPILQTDQPFDLNPVYHNLPVEQNAGTTVADLIAGRWSDADGDICGIAVSRFYGWAYGEWQIDLVGDGGWLPLVEEPPPSIRFTLPPAAGLRFVPSVAMSVDIDPALEFVAWDQSQGEPGTFVGGMTGGFTAYSEAQGTARLAIRSWNVHQPVITTPGEGFTLLMEEDIPDADNDGVLVGSVIEPRASDDDGDILGGAISQISPASGQWQYRLAANDFWQTMDWPANAGYLLLAPSNRIRFSPDPDWHGTTFPLALRLNAWDQTFGRPGELVDPNDRPPGQALSISSSYLQLYAEVTPVPDAPIIFEGSSFEVLLELNGFGGGTANVGDLLAGKVADADGDVCGMAVFVVNHTDGRWFFSDIDAGSGQLIWVDFGSPSRATARLLDPDRDIRFVPEASFTGSLLEGLAFRAWDQTYGNDGDVADIGFPGGRGTSREFAYVSVRQKTIPMVTVGDPGNWADDTGYGTVDYIYQIAEVEVSNRDYCAFLNAVASADPLGLFHSEMTDDVTRGGIERSGEPGSYLYSCKPGREDWPVNYVTYYSSLRFINWLHHGGGNGDTESGAYTLEGGGPTPTNVNDIRRDPDARVFLPSEDEWYKAAYYAAGSGPTGYYYEYPTQNDTPPNAWPPPGDANSANLRNALGYPAPVGSYPQTVSGYGAYDLAGNIAERVEWNPTVLAGHRAHLRGGHYNVDATVQAAASAAIPRPYYDQVAAEFGFRIAARAQFLNNAAPVLRYEGVSNLGPGLGPMNVGLQVHDLLANLVVDLDLNPSGMAVTGVTRQYGEWQYASIDPGNGDLIWHSIGQVSESHALLLDPDRYLRFIPNPATHPGGSVEGLTFRAWDQTAGTEGAYVDTTLNGEETPFSTAQKLVLGRNDSMVVGDSDNPPDDTGFGTVAYPYRIGAFEVSNREYCAFLNAVAAEDPYALYHPFMTSEDRGGITRLGEPGAFTYTTRSEHEDWPVNFISYYSMLRFANWIHNGQLEGDTEEGAYHLEGGTPEPSNYASIVREAQALVFIPSEDEWYKAAYYAGGDSGIYYEFSTQTDDPPIGEPPPGGVNSANLAAVGRGPYAVGSYPEARSAYGTYDQTGNVGELMEGLDPTQRRARARGGSYLSDPVSQASASMQVPRPYPEQASYATWGFRLAAPAPVPLPAPAIGVSRSGTDPLLHLTWRSEDGLWYQVQEINDLGSSRNPDQWRNVDDPLKGTGDDLSKDVGSEGSGGGGGSGTTRFYRILVLPE